MALAAVRFFLARRWLWYRSCRHNLEDDFLFPLVLFSEKPRATQRPHPRYNTQVYSHADLQTYAPALQLLEKKRAPKTHNPYPEKKTNYEFLAKKDEFFELFAFLFI